MNIVILDAETINPGDLNWDRLSELGNLTVYDRCTYEEAKGRIKDANAVFFSKVEMDEELISYGKNMKFLGITATGYDNLDVDFAREKNIACCNIPAYSTDAVAQHTIALMLEYANRIGMHNDDIHKGNWTEEKGFCYWNRPLVLLKGKTLGIVGYGSIGKRVKEIAEALGMKVHIYSKDREKTMKSDIISLHIPANKDTTNFINQESIDEMKNGVVLINTSRGTLINEEDLLVALNSGKISCYCSDVLIDEPPKKDNPLLTHEKCVLTPHNAWSPVEARSIVCETCADNLKSWIDGGQLNRLDT